MMRSVSAFLSNSFSKAQLTQLSSGMDKLEKTECEGFYIGSVALHSDEFIPGMSSVATELLELSNCDALVLGISSPAKKKKKKSSSENNGQEKSSKEHEVPQISIIGRARARMQGIDLADMFSELGGGGHPKAAAVTVKGTEAGTVEELVDGFRQKMIASVPKATLVRDFMSSPVITVSRESTMKEARDAMREHSVSGVVIVEEESSSDVDAKEGKIALGVVSRSDVLAAEMSNSLERPLKGTYRSQLLSITADRPLHEAEALMTQHQVGRLPVLDEKRIAIGIVTRSDVLKQRGLA
mmetsp:Transcript_10048/g.18116  ORF Transcript_10048/g.18116 Transcript_10048/m.18116 type:complete len:297 (-) Transcript_10048:454-1344(-)